MIYLHVYIYTFAHVGDLACTPAPGGRAALRFKIVENTTVF